MKPAFPAIAFFAPFALWTCSAAAQAPEQTIKFSGYEWIVKHGEKLGPGPNVWNPSNVFVDSEGRLHLKITQKDARWECAEIRSTKRFGFGTFQFQIVGRVDTLDPNIVLGLFTYPTPDVGSDTTNEIDIEFAHWGNPAYPIGNYTVWPPQKGVKESSQTFKFALTGENTTQRFQWQSKSILFQSLHGHRDDNKEEYGRWLFGPVDFKKRVPQAPVPVLLNLWLFQGKPPTDGKEVEIIVRKFTYKPGR